MLTEEECYLAAIFDDPSGIELAEFMLIDEEQPDACTRVYDYQWTWFRADDRFQIDAASRDVGKSFSIILRCLAWPFNFPGAEMLLTAPELSHLRPLCDKVENTLLNTRLLREMLPNRRGRGINHQPQFQVQFVNNARILSRLPQRDGRGVKGIHALRIELDEAQDYPTAGWTEMIESMKHRTSGSQWRIHGVSRGVHDTFSKYQRNDDPNLPFRVHRVMAMHRPTWGDEERRNKIALYGGTEEHVDYKRNVLGEMADASSTLFVSHRLMACCRIMESTWATQYNDDVYTKIKVSDELLKGSNAPIETFLQFNHAHLGKEYTSFWGGADIGFTRDPSEMLIFGELPHPTKKGESLLRLLLRLHMMRVSASDQAAAVRSIFDFYGERLRRFTLDRTGVGLPLWQELDPEAVGTHVERRRTPEHISRRIKGYGFSEKVPVEFDDRELKEAERPEDAVITKNVVEFAADELRKLVDTGCIELPFDQELLTEWQGQQIQYVRDDRTAAGLKTKLVGGSLHTLDGSMMMIAGRNLAKIEEALKVQKKRVPVLASFM